MNDIAGPERLPVICSPSRLAPCEIEERLREVLPRCEPPSVRDLQREFARELASVPTCRAAGPLPPAEDPSTATGNVTTNAVAAACGAARLVATHLGLGAALRLRLRSQATQASGPCELMLQVDAEQGLSVDEQLTLLQVAEEAVTQVQREGSRELNVTLRRSRLGSVELSVSGGGGGIVAERVSDSFRCLARIRRLATQIDARLAVRRLADGSLMVRCRTRWLDSGTGRWTAPG